MNNTMSRREFFGTMAAASVALTPLARGIASNQTGASPTAAAAKTAPYQKVILWTFDYQGVALRSSRWQEQAYSARDFYMSLSTNDVLKGFRQAAGLPAPGEVLGGWARRNSYVVFGQWLQAMARFSRANGDTIMRDRAALWVSEWGKTLVSDRAARLGHYTFEKMVGGLIDMHHYAGHPEAAGLMDKITQWAIDNLNRERTPAAPRPWELHSGRPLEWYTVAENLYRAYQLTDNDMYKEFAEVWLYKHFWDKFYASAAPADAMGVHAYSHVNSLSSAAMAYDVSGDTRCLHIMRNFYDFMQNTQCYATGGYGPAERLMPLDGALGDSLAIRIDSFEAPCCSWAAFKLAKYLMMYTGEARFGDWIEKLLYNGIGAALPIMTGGKHFYYANYHLGAAMKTHSRTPFTCCSGTYFQNIAEYQNLIYFKDDTGLYVNLYIPSEVIWEVKGRTVKFTQETSYPEAETSMLRLEIEQPTEFVLKLRVPCWSDGVSFRLNGSPYNLGVHPGTWAAIRRVWQPGDWLEITIPLRFRRAPIDQWHPNRVALVRGPVVYAQQVVHKEMPIIPPDDDKLNKWLVPTDDPTVFKYANQEEVSQRDNFMPYYRYPEVTSYRMYFDPGLRSKLW